MNDSQKNKPNLPLLAFLAYLIVPKDKSIGLLRLFNKIVFRLLILFLVSGLIFMFLIGATATDNYNFCISDMDAAQHWTLDLLQENLFDRCTTNKG